MYAQIFKEQAGFKATVAKLMADGHSEESARRIAYSISKTKPGAKSMAAKPAEVQKAGTSEGAILGWKSRRLSGHPLNQASDQELRATIAQNKSIMQTARDILVGRKVPPTKSVMQSAKNILIGEKGVQTKTIMETARDILVGRKVNKGFVGEVLGVTHQGRVPNPKHVGNPTNGVLVSRF